MMIECRVRNCEDAAVGYGRVYHEYSDGGPPFDCHMAYCGKHLADRSTKYENSEIITFQSTMEDYRPNSYDKVI